MISEECGTRSMTSYILVLSALIAQGFAIVQSKSCAYLSLNRRISPGGLKIFVVIYVETWSRCYRLGLSYHALVVVFLWKAITITVVGANEYNVCFLIKFFLPSSSVETGLLRAKMLGKFSAIKAHSIIMLLVLLWIFKNRKDTDWLQWKVFFLFRLLNGYDYDVFEKKFKCLNRD